MIMFIFEFPKISSYCFLIALLLVGCSNNESGNSSSLVVTSVNNSNHDYKKIENFSRDYEKAHIDLLKMPDQEVISTF